MHLVDPLSVFRPPPVLIKHNKHSKTNIHLSGGISQPFWVIARVKATLTLNGPAKKRRKKSWS